ncbi:hypothetical protein GCM10011359_02610 [Nesterenkonia alkaliphila]|uniref:hypothetical protein n=1 Tax=Nesterenkonia alkaliphila TaxID=1463631 RepID=UPI0018DF8AC1|nr:hypothetical protein [Nesterenkonia alkaliphila]GFZ77971.1 hypothetical protein GCM10011359_02610 [Nesterenkonia alkaliphila]
MSQNEAEDLPSFTGFYRRKALGDDVAFTSERQWIAGMERPGKRRRYKKRENRQERRRIRTRLHQRFDQIEDQ